MQVNHWNVRDRLSDFTTRPNHGLTCQLALELFETLLRIESDIRDAQEFAAERSNARDQLTTLLDGIEGVRERVEKMDEILIEVFGAKTEQVAS